MKMRIAFAAILLLAIVLSGCTTTGTPQATVAPSPTGGPQPTAAGTVTPSAQTGMTTENGVTTITGSGDQTVQVPMEEGGYLLRYRYKNDFDITHTASSGMSVPLFTSAGAAMGPDGYYTMSRVEHWYSADTETVEIKANGPYIVEIVKLPHGEAASAPQTYTGAGWLASGPIHLNASTASFKISCPDAKQAGFTVTLKDGTTGQQVQSIANNFVDGTGNSYDATKTATIDTSGAYYVEVNSNSGATWEITVSQ